MARLRTFDSTKLYHITNRTVGGQYLVKSELKVNIIIAYYLAKFQQKFPIRIYAFAFMDNHFHLLVRGEGKDISQFMKRFQESVARDINTLRNRRGHLWAGRYQAIPVLDSESALYYLCYILLNPVKAGLCRTPSQSPGLNAAGAILRGDKYFRFSWNEDEEGHPIPKGDNTKVAKKCSVKIRLHVLPSLANKSAEKRRTVVNKALRSHPSNIKARNISPRNYRPTSKPNTELITTSEKAPLCHAACEKRKTDYIKSRKEIIDEYYKAARHYIRGHLKRARFPRGTFPPSRHPGVKCCGKPC